MKNLLRFLLLPLAAALPGVFGCAPKPVLDNPDRPALEALIAEVDQDRLMGVVEALVTSHQNDAKVDCSSFPASFPQLCQVSNAQAGALVQSRFEELGLAVRRHEVEGPRFATSNIIAELPGASRPEEIVLIGAHYDAFFQGADDNSSGVAAMLELARVFSRHRFDRTVRFVAFDLEELGLIGSNRYVDTVKNERLVATVIFDCLAYYSTEPDSQGSLPGLPTPSTGDFLAVIGNDLSSQRAAEVNALNDLLKIMKVIPLIAPRDGTFPIGSNLLRSDHTPFWLTGQEALFLTDTANFRNPNYHKESDTLDTLHPASFRKAVQLSAASVAYWAGGPR